MPTFTASLMSQTIVEARENPDADPPVDRALLERYVRGELSRKDFIEVFIIVEECNSWFQAYREILERIRSDDAQSDPPPVS